MRTPTPAGAPTRQQLRHFGWLLSLLLAVAARRLAPAPAALGMQVLAAALFAVATVWPGSLRRPTAVLMVLTAPLRWVVGRLLLVVIYCGLLTPLALMLRLLGRDTLRRRLEPEVASYWQPRCAADDRSRSLRPF